MPGPKDPAYVAPRTFMPGPAKAGHYVPPHPAPPHLYPIAIKSNCS